jgi:peroxiredoxin Q/BCP
MHNMILSMSGWKAEHGFKYPLLSDVSKEVMTSLGCINPETKKIVRSHYVVAKGGVVQDVQLGVGSKDSVPLALAFVTGK